MHSPTVKLIVILGWITWANDLIDILLFLPLKSSGPSNAMTYRPKRIAVETVSVMIAFNPHVATGDSDKAFSVSNGSRKKQCNQWDKNRRETKELGIQK